MIALYAAKAWGFLKGVPWQVYAAVGAALLLWFVYAEGKDAGREEVMAELREAEAKAVKRSEKAASKADTKAAKREEAEAAVIAEQIEAIEAAEASGENALDALF